MADKYQRNEDQIFIQASKIEELWNTFIKHNDNSIDDTKYNINKLNLVQAIDNVEKRKDYFRFYHGIELNELKEVALLCFWIIKLKPFTMLVEDTKLLNHVNEVFCLFLILSTIKHITKINSLPFIDLSDKHKNEIIYTFKYRDLSKEAMMLFVETLAFSYNINVYN